ncbi:MAG TPA: toxin-antitoxin system HicB family antitoxin [Bacilli bacterium]|nr:toxin-antitoxin system HicB family antitoxin [Bacilli bacterium]
MDVDYGLKISLLSDEDGGGYLVEVPDLPGCVTDGDTLDEAIRKAGEATESWLEAARECGRKIPEKKYYSSEDDYSGKLTLRMPKSLHRELAQAAAEEGVSINQLILSYISYGFGKATAEHACTHTQDERKTSIRCESFLEFVMYHEQNWEPKLTPFALRNQTMTTPQYRNREGQ